MKMTLILLRLSIFIFDFQFISSTNGHWCCSFESATNCFLHNSKGSKSSWKILSSYNYTSLMAYQGNFYLGGELAISEGTNRLLLESEELHVPKIKMCLGFHFYIKGSGIKYLKIFTDLTKPAVWTFAEHTGSWNYTEIEFLASKLYIEATCSSNWRVVFALDEINLRTGNCNATYSTRLSSISSTVKDSNDKITRSYSREALSNKATDHSRSVEPQRNQENSSHSTDFNIKFMTQPSSKVVSIETSQNGESSTVLTLGKQISSQTEAIQNELNTTVPLDNSTGRSTTPEIRITITRFHVSKAEGKGVGIGLGCTTAVLVILAIVVLLIKYRTRLNDLKERHSKNQRIAVHMDSLYDDILEEGQASRRAFTVGTCRVSYDSIPGTGEAGIYSEISPEGTNRNRNTTVSAEVTHYARTNQDMCVYNHLNEAQEGHRNTYEEFSVYNLLSKQSTSRENKTFDNEYDCSDSIKNRHDDVL